MLVKVAHGIFSVSLSVSYLCSIQLTYTHIAVYNRAQIFMPIEYTTNKHDGKIFRLHIANPS